MNAPVAEESVTSRFAAMKAMLSKGAA